MTIVFNNAVLTYQQWQNLNEQDKALYATAMGYGTNVDFVDTALSAGETLQPGINQPSADGATLTTTDPSLTPPDWTLVSTGTLGLTLTTDILSVLGFNFSETVTSLFAGTVPEEELAYIREALKEEFPTKEFFLSTAENPPVGAPETPPLTGSGLSQLWNNIENSVIKGTVTVPEDCQEIVENMSSQDPAKVREALSQIIDLEKYNLTDNQKALVESKLDILANTIADSVAEGGSAAFFIRLGLPEVLALQFGVAVGLPSDTTMSEADKEILKQIFFDAGTNLAEINFTYAASVKPPSIEYTQLTSQNAEQLSTLMTTLLNSIAIPEGVMTEEERSLFIATLAEELSGKPLNKELASCSEEEVSAALNKLIEDLSKKGKLPGGAALITTLSMYIVPGLSQKIAAINQDKALNDLYSTDATVIDGALRKLGNLPPMLDLEGLENLSPEELNAQYGKTIVLESYLKALVKALSFLAQIRCLISSLEGQFSQELAKAKMAALADEVRSALAMHQEQLDKIKSEFGAQLKALATAATMRWVMPLISTIVAILALVAAVIITILTFGLAAPAAVAAGTWVVAAIIITLSTVVCVISIVDSVRASLGKKGSYEMITDWILEEIGSINPPPWLKALVNCIIQVVIALAIALLTFGAGMVTAMLAKATEKIMSAIMTAIMKTLMTLVMSCVLQPLLSSGLFIQGLLKLLELIFPRASELNNTIIAAIIQMVILFGVMILMFVAQRSINAKIVTKAVETGAEAAKGGAKAAEAGTQAAALAAKGATETAAKTAAETTKMAQNALTRMLSKFFGDLVKALGDVAPDASDLVKSMSKNMTKGIELLSKGLCKASEFTGKVLPEILKKIDSAGRSMEKHLNSLVDNMKGPAGVMFALETTKGLLSIGVSVTLGINALEKAQYQRELARITEELAELEAQLSLLESLSSLSLDQTATLKNISKDAEAEASEWVKLVNLVASFINDASKNFNLLVTEGAAH